MNKFHTVIKVVFLIELLLAFSFLHHTQRKNKDSQSFRAHSIIG
ncbi:MAG TPA: hypothetical protein VIN72_09435 [Lutibacter sp.]